MRNTDGCAEVSSYRWHRLHRSPPVFCTIAPAQSDVGVHSWPISD